MATTPREELKELVHESLTRDLSASADFHPEQQSQLDELANAKAEELIRNFERYLITEDVKDIILNDVRKELKSSTRFDRLIEGGLFIVPLVLSFLLFLLTPLSSPNNFAQTNVQVVIVIALVLSVFQALLFIAHKVFR